MLQVSGTQRFSTIPTASATTVMVSTLVGVNLNAAPLAVLIKVRSAEDHGGTQSMN